MATAYIISCLRLFVKHYFYAGQKTAKKLQKNQKKFRLGVDFFEEMVYNIQVAWRANLPDAEYGEVA